MRLIQKMKLLKPVSIDVTYLNKQKLIDNQNAWSSQKHKNKFGEFWFLLQLDWIILCKHYKVVLDISLFQEK